MLAIHEHVIVRVARGDRPAPLALGHAPEARDV